MESSGPLNPSDVSLHSSYPSPIVVPLDLIHRQSRASREDMPIDESGLYMMSKALEEFMRHLVLKSTNNGENELTYDRIAAFIARSEFKALKEFFPERVLFGDIMHLLPNYKPPTTSTSESTSKPSSSQNPRNM